MPSIAKPIATHPSLQKNDLGLTIRDYEGTMSTLCAGSRFSPDRSRYSSMITRSVGAVFDMPMKFSPAISCSATAFCDASR